MMLPSRQLEILKIIIEDYVGSGQPVGSQYLIKQYQLPYSSATIRNEMMALEQLGYLEKTHTSSGRIPSSEGYRFYTDMFAPSEYKEYSRIVNQESLFERGQLFGDVVEKAVRLLSNMSQCPVVYLGPSVLSRKLKQLQIIPISQSQALIVMQTDDGKTETEIFPYIGNMTEDVLHKIGEVFQERLEGEVLPRVIRKMETELKPIFMQRIAYYDYFHQVLVNLVNKLSTQTQLVVGASELLHYPEFTSTEAIAQILKVLESKDGLNDLIPTNKKGVFIQLGDEIEVSGFENCALITQGFNELNGVATISILGPMRINYPEMMTFLDYITKQLANY